MSSLLKVIIWGMVILLFTQNFTVTAFSNTQSLRGRQAKLLPRWNNPTHKRTYNISKLKLSETIAGTNDDALKGELAPLPSSDLDSTPNRWISSLPSVGRGKFGDELDHMILSSALPSMLNMAVVPIVNAVDTFWVGRLGITLALAGQSAANQAFFTLFFLVSFLPTITAPLVATAVGSGDMKEAQNKVCEALFLSNMLGALGTIILVCFPRTSLGLVLPKDAAAMSFAIPYLRYRALSMIPALISSTGFAAYRGLLNTVTPLKVSLFTNLVNLVADPFFVKGMGVSGAAIATAGAETFSGLIYIRLLMRRNLVRLSSMFKVPSWKSIKTIIQGGSAMLLFQLAINVAFVTAARRVQAMDPSGVAAAAYGIVMQIYSVGVVMHLGIKATAATLVPSERSKKGDDAARAMADKLFMWGTIVGLILGFLQMALLPFLIPLFTTIPEVRDAIRVPALISSLIQFANGPLFAGEGIMVGLGTFKALTCCTVLGASIMVSCIYSQMGASLNGILLSLAAFNIFQAAAMVWHHLKKGPLKR
mmetsp:Transcript_657/g.1162  ORF Transcript_657/g.1162 Transcript_657/m.1162 type:complete len:535 (-) Transcript_657:1558-3162(-)|eukprot:CAMPEP_0176485940 /NCGR_PEP_ID=MMETSP0200_2-20121128/5307_1 /TAXON_ID=947934 /ORGANISM="Chaetoceros sp., Strain GSL56" /LENGTH=534 /DNA_ID=CAMNT_0017882617 /DNA_START=72 /DNA_END=1676 /DNA_ORIENTATION=-